MLRLLSVFVLLLAASPVVAESPATVKSQVDLPVRKRAWSGTPGISGGELSLPVVWIGSKNANDNTLRAYHVRLHFIEPAHAKPGKRIFDVHVEGQPAILDFDIAKESTNPQQPLVKELPNISITGPLNIKLLAKVGAPVLCGLELIAK